MKRILVATHEYHGTGAAVMLNAVLENWVCERGWLVDVYAFDPSLSIPTELLDAGVRKVESIRPDQYDLVLVNTVAHPGVLQFAVENLTPGIPSLLWVHEGDFVLWSSSLLPRDWARVFRAFSHIVFQSPWQRDRVFASFLTAVPAAGVSVIANGLPPFAAPPQSRQRRHGGERRVISFIGGVYPRKRPGDLALAVAALGRSDLECRFIGSTQHIQSCSEGFRKLLSDRPEAYRLLGEQPRAAIAGLLADSDVFCLPSEQETQSLSTLEAASLGVPVCVSDLPPYEGIWRHGENCLMHPVGNLDILANNLGLILNNPEVADSLVRGAATLPQRFGFRRFLEAFTATAAGLFRGT